MVKHRVNRNGVFAIPQQVQADDAETGRLLAHWAQRMNSPFVGRTSLHHTINILERSEQREVTTPWPEMDDVLNLSPGRLSCLGTRSRSREARAGYDIAVHNVACGLRAVLFAPDLTARNPVRGLTIDRTRLLTTDHMHDVLTAKVGRGEPADLVVIDRPQMMHTEQAERVRTPEDAEMVSMDLKRMALGDPVPRRSCADAAPSKVRNA
ncbi:hypothetical protein GCM10010211_11870 [Streptomyces albospinus]|uniref:Uncharacterized protein n=1 Tax=Streptomyces albospinus TaxID=285515 RepID=A0ABQ2UUP4_9ACTN|nr:hypothetical protein [Streptomyces albospinus]GGU49338.1 hypothetical protein GCM10010211_11870 [Streptomyces albospinus]